MISRSTETAMRPSDIRNEERNKHIQRDMWEHRTEKITSSDMRNDMICVISKSTKSTMTRSDIRNEEINNHHEIDVSKDMTESIMSTDMRNEIIDDVNCTFMSENVREITVSSSHHDIQEAAEILSLQMS